MKNEVTEYLMKKCRTSSSLIKIWNLYCDEKGLKSRKIYYMAEFNTVMSGSCPLDIAFSIRFGEFTPTDNYFLYDENGVLTSYKWSSDITKAAINFSLLTDYLMERDFDFFDKLPNTPSIYDDSTKLKNLIKKSRENLAISK